MRNCMKYPVLLMPLMASVCSAEPAAVTPAPAAPHIQQTFHPLAGITASDGQSMRADGPTMAYSGGVAVLPCSRRCA